MANFYGAIDLIGGSSGALDAIDGVDLADGDGAVVITQGKSYLYHLNGTLGGSESSPQIISPDNNAGNKRWVLTAGVDRNLSVYTDKDSDNNLMGRSHAYLAMSDGLVTCYDVGLDAGKSIFLYVGDTNDPAGAGLCIECQESDGTNRTQTVSGLVAAGEYFEIVSEGGGAVNMRWKSFGILCKPVDQD